MSLLLTAVPVGGLIHILIMLVIIGLVLVGSKPSDTVLDPFAGSGTVGKVALELGRRAVLIELNPQYVKLAERRCDVTPGFPYAV